MGGSILARATSISASADNRRNSAAFMSGLRNRSADGISGRTRGNLTELKPLFESFISTGGEPTRADRRFSTVSRCCSSTGIVALTAYTAAFCCSISVIVASPILRRQSTDTSISLNDFSESCAIRKRSLSERYSM